MSETNCVTCMIGRFKYLLCDDRFCKKYARNGSSEDFEKFLLDKDLVVIVRCEDCVFSKKMGRELFCEDLSFYTKPDWFCADGERRGEEDE